MNEREKKEFNKAFNDFDKACTNAMDACQSFIEMDINKTSEPTLEERVTLADDVRKNPTQRDEGATPWGRIGSSERQVDMNGDVYIREQEDYLDRD